MLLQIIAAICGLITAALIVNLVQLFVETKKSFYFYKKYSNGLPLADGFKQLGGHLDLFLGTRSWKFLDNNHKKHGKTFAWFYSWRPFVSTVDLDLIQSIIFEKPQEINRSNGYDFPVPEFEINQIIFAKDDQWRRLRKAIAPAMSAHKVRAESVQTLLMETINKFLTSLDNRLETAQRNGRDHIILDVEDHMRRYTLAQAFSCLYKQHNEIDFYAEEDVWQHKFDILARRLNNPIVSLAIMIPFIRPPIRWFMTHIHPLGIQKKVLLNFVRKQTKDNLAARLQINEMLKTKKLEEIDQDNIVLPDGTVFQRNMIDYVIDQFHDKKIGEEEYLNSTALLLIAANKTSADTLAKLIYFLALNPEIQEKLRREILKDGENSEYLLWCINETLRLYPPVPEGSTRCVSLDMTTKEGYVIKAGTTVMTPLTTIHRMKEYYGADAEEFRPERFADSKDWHPIQFMPFGVGSRKCLGADFAMVEMKRLMDPMMRKYKFEFVPGTNDDMQFETPWLIFTVFDGPTNIKFSKWEPDVDL